MNMLAFDYGASSGRGILGTYDGALLTLNELRRFANEPVTLGAHLVWDFPRLYREIGQTLAVAGREHAITSLGVNTWGVDFGLIDRDGLLIGCPFHYRDTLTEGAMESVFSFIPRRKLYDRTGVQLMRINTLFQLFALRQRYPSMLERARHLLLMPDLFNYFLTGARTAEYSIASTTQLLDVRRRTWDADLLRCAGVDPSILPEVTPSGSLLGPVLPSIADEVGCAPKVVSICGHDTASAVLAVPTKPGERCAYISCGTWSLLGVELDAPLTHDAAYEAQYTNEGGFGYSIRFLKNIMGQWIHQELKREYERGRGPVGFAELDALELAAPAFGSLIDPDDDSFLTPGHMSEKIRAFCLRTGQTPPDSLGAALRCATESLALKYRYALCRLEDVLGYRLSMVRVVGGGCRNLPLMHAAASALGRPVCVGPVEASAVGNLCAQLIALDELPGLSQARELVRESFPVQTYAPGDTSPWDEAYGRFLRLLPTP